MNMAETKMNYKIIDREKYYRKGVFRHFSEDCKCSTSMTARIDVTALKDWSKKSGTKFYINFLYILSKVLNSRDDYKMALKWESGELICYDQINDWGKYREESGRFVMPVSVRLNHAIADGYLIAKVFKLLQDEMEDFVKARLI